MNRRLSYYHFLILSIISVIIVNRNCYQTQVNSQEKLGQNQKIYSVKYGIQ